MKNFNAKTYPMGENLLWCEIFMLRRQEILFKENTSQGNVMRKFWYQNVLMPQAGTLFEQGLLKQVSS